MLNIDTDEANGPARDPADPTGESVSQAVTVALRERLDRVREVAPKAAPVAAKETTEAFVARIMALVDGWGDIDRRPVTEEERIEAGGDDWDLAMLEAERAARK